MNKILKSGDKISIIIPVYNGEKTISKCISSVQSQSYKNLEIVIVDDGSKDNTLKICNNIALSDERIRIYKKENGGVSSARNLGLTKATGKYVQFIDCDDYIYPEMCATLYRNMQKSKVDLVICGMVREFIFDNKIYTNHITLKTEKCCNEYSKNLIFPILYTSGYLNAPVNKLYIRDIIHSHKITFNENISLGEDLIFNLAYLRKTKCFLIIPNTLYYITAENNTSLTKAFRDEKIEEISYLYYSIENYIADNFNKTECQKVNILMYFRSVYLILEQLIGSNLSTTMKKKKYMSIVKNRNVNNLFKVDKRYLLFESKIYILCLKLPYFLLKSIVLLRAKIKKIYRKIKLNNTTNIGGDCPEF